MGMDKSSALAEADRLKQALRERMNEAKRQAEQAEDPEERKRQTERERILRNMYADACAEVRRLSGSFQKTAPGNTHLDFEISGSAAWSDMNGCTWSAMEADLWSGFASGEERKGDSLNSLLRESAEVCTQRQREMLLAYYGQQQTMAEIARRFGVNESTVSRTVQKGMRRVSQLVLARLTMPLCLDGGRFDYMKFCRNTGILEERQLEMLYMSLAPDACQADIARYLGRDKSNVSRTLSRAKERLRRVHVEVIPEADTGMVRRRDWSELTETALAERLGLSRRFFYAEIHAGEQIYGLPLTHYHLLCRIRGEGWPLRAAAGELGVSYSCASAVAARCRDANLPLDLGNLPRYEPVKMPRDVGGGELTACLRDLARGETEITQIDRETLRRSAAGRRQ
jgi:DNA-directed RNA polymerase specialized sigma24 family protein